MTYDGPRFDESTWRASVTNGRIDRDRLAIVEFWPHQYDRDLDGPALMHPEAASAMGVMLRQATEDGFGDLGIGLSYRTYEMQVEKYNDYKYHKGNLAAYPGTSNHGLGLSCDMNWGRVVSLTWLQQHARKYGFIADVRGENWHYTYQEGLWNGDDMTEKERQKINDTARATNGILAGVKDFLNHKEPPNDASDERRQTYRALKLAAKA